jgi:hypothetical protein
MKTGATFHILRASEGGPSRAALIAAIRAAGVPCRPGPRSYYVGHVTIDILTGDKRKIARAQRIAGVA